MTTETPTPLTDAAELEANIGVTCFDHSDIAKAFSFARSLERDLARANEMLAVATEALKWFRDRYRHEDLGVSGAALRRIAEMKEIP